MILQAIHNQLPNITSLEVNVDKNFIFIGRLIFIKEIMWEELVSMILMIIMRMI